MFVITVEFYMKVFVSLIVLFYFISACSTGTDSTGLYVIDDNVESSFNKYDYKYKLLYLETRNNNNSNNIKESQKLFKNFGDSIGKQGVVVDFSEKDINSRKRYLDKIQRDLNTSYKYYDGPFLVFFKRNQFDGNFKPYEMISFSQSPLSCTKDYLSSIEQVIYNSKSNKETADRLSQIQFGACNVVGTFNQEQDATKKFNKLVKIIISWFR